MHETSPMTVSAPVFFNALCTYIKPISMLGSLTMIGTGPGPHHTYSPIIISWNKMEKALHLTRKQWVSQSYYKKIKPTGCCFFSFFFFEENNYTLPLVHGVYKRT